MTPKIIQGKKIRENKVRESKKVQESKVQENKRGRGRPAVFDRAIALSEAMKLFWERGYEGTSFDDLIAAMGISASSFYNSFGSKEALYCEATRSYLEWSGQWFFAILNDPSIDTKTAFARLFEATAEEFTRGDHPLGCMIALAGTHCPPGMSNIRDMMAEHRAFSESAMAARIRKGVANGDVPEDADCDMLAAYYSAVARGLAVQARDGASRDKLAQIGRLAMSAWPARKRG
jgi:AcrR family transcriptional regulator